MKLYNSEYRKYVEEYISLGLQIGYFDYTKIQEFRDKLYNIDITIDNSIPGDAYFGENGLIINKNRMFKSGEEYESLTFFHEFTHMCSNLHDDLFNKRDKGLINKLSNNANKFTNTDYNYGYLKTKKGDVNNPFTYISFGAMLIDEVTAENVATEMVRLKYNKVVPFSNKQKVYGKNIVNYKSHFDYYGIGEELVEGFSKTLFMQNQSRNLNGLCRDIFKKDFVYNLIRQHNEKNYSMSCLIEELAYLGVVCFEEEKSNGHLKNREAILPEIVYDSYLKLKDLLIKGRENRECIPNYIPFPSFMD